MQKHEASQERPQFRHRKSGPVTRKRGAAAHDEVRTAVRGPRELLARN